MFDVAVIGDGVIATVIKNGFIQFPSNREGTVSVFAVDGDAVGVTIEGLKYPLKDHTLTFSNTLGVSNSFVGKEGSVSVKEGELLVFLEEKNLRPCRI